MDASEGDECGDGSYTTLRLPRPSGAFGLVPLSVSVRETADGGEVSGVGADAGDLFAGGQPGRRLFDTAFRGREGRACRLLRARKLRAQAGVAELVLVNQRGLQFVPRVQAIELGQTIRFTNQDGETHNVHVVSPDFAFNQSMSPGQSQISRRTRRA